MCGIVGAAAQRNVSAILIEGLKRLEYRGYDSAGLALINDHGSLDNRKRLGKVSNLEEAAKHIKGRLGIAHTRWATHGKPSETNAHPHLSHSHLAVVHNGIIENYRLLRDELQQAGYQFISETDSEVVAHLLDFYFDQQGSLIAAMQAAVKRLEGAYALAVIDTREPDQLVIAREGSPLVLGCGIEENFVASDQLALRQVTDRFIYLEEGDIAQISADQIQIWDATGAQVEREIVQLHGEEHNVDKGNYRHYMLKEIYEQPTVLENALQGRLAEQQINESVFGSEAGDLFSQVQRVCIVACGTSYHAGLIAKDWIESLAGLPCQVEVASEFRYRKVLVEANTLFVTISQSGETADTLAALKQAKTLGYLATLAICNVPVSSLVRESDLAFMTHAGPEIGVASTKAFTTQLVANLLLAVALARHQGLSAEVEADIVAQLKRLPVLCEQILDLNQDIRQLSEAFANKYHALFLGRGVYYPVAKEGALKLKEISYIHAEAYPAGELKHGPLALVDDKMPVVALAHNDELLDKLKSNLQEVMARGGELFVITDIHRDFANEEGLKVIELPRVDDIIAPIVFTIPLQLLAYHVAVLKGTDVDQPRNLAKSVTVE